MNISKNKRRRKRPIGSSLYCAIVAVVVLFGIFSIFGPTGRIVKEHHQKALRQLPRRMILKMVEVKDMVHESIMHKTIRDCLPSQNKNCMTFVPEPLQGDAEKMQRVALIAPPGRLSSGLNNHMNLVVDEYNRLENRKDPKIEVIATSHVPPYGYGKSHGLTRIIKLMPQPIVLQVTDALKAVLAPNQNAQSITFEDVQVGLLQILRMHCRLSHVAAHTASMTIDKKTLVNATKLGLDLRNFMAPYFAKMHPVGVAARGNDDTEITADDDEIRVVYDQASVGAGILTRLSENMSSNADILALLDRVLQEELERTKTMSVWPCPSFWDPPPPLRLSALTRELAKALSPDCDDPHVSCFVKKDKCEAAGDPVCKNK